MTMSGKWKITVDTTTAANGDSIAAYLTSAAGTLLTHTTNGAKQALDVYQAGAFAEDAAHTSGDLGQFILAVRNDTEGSMTSANGDYAPLQVDSLGRLRVNADINVNNDFVYAEDSAAASGDLGASVLLVRQDTLAASTSADGDYGHFKSTAAGELYTFDTTSHTTLSSILTELQSLTHAEDAAHVSGDAGVMSLAVRNDAGVALAADGDYIPLTTDSLGRLRTTALATLNFEYAEDSAASSGAMGAFILGIRRDTAGPSTSAAGDYSELQTWSNGELKAVDICNSSVLQQEVSVATLATILPTTALSSRKRLLIQNVDNASVWVGSATVTATGATGGIELPKGGVIEIEAGPACSVYAIASGSARNVRVLECA